MKATLKVQLFDPSTDSPLVTSGTTITVKQAPLPTPLPPPSLVPVPEDTGATSGPFRSYTVDTGSTGVIIELTITVTAKLTPLGSSASTSSIGSPALEIKQFLIITDDGKSTSWVPMGSNCKLSNGLNREVHPRLTFAAGAPNQPAETRVDLTFVDMTGSLRAVKPMLFEGYDKNLGRGFEPKPEDPHHGCELHVLELTRGKPKTWLAVVPRAAREPGRSTLHVVVFYRPSLPVGYRDTRDVDLRVHRMLEVHLRDPPICAPFYWWGCAKDPVWVLPNAGFEGQLEASKKAIIFVVPLPHGDVDTSGTTRASAPNLDQLMNALLLALFSDGALGADPANVRPTLGTLALLGLSFGGSGAYAALKNNSAHVSELYLMDPSERIAADKAKLVKDWFLKGPRGSRRKLRMVAGYGLKEMQDLRNELVAKAPGRANDVSISPSDAAFFNTPGNIYHQAVIPRGASPADEVLDVPDNASKPTVSALSRDTGVFLNSSAASAGSVGDPSEVVVPGAKPIVRPGLEATPIELAGIIRANWWLPAAARKPASTPSELGDLLDSHAIGALGKPPKPADGHWIRHLWASAGGIGSPSRTPHGTQDAVHPDGKAFEGHLLFCLKGGHFP